MTEAVLVLEDGRTFHGEAYGAVGETIGEAVFSTGMTGYQETLTDPSYHRQVVVMTAPHIGNTGVNDEDAESGRIWVAGYVVRDPARLPSSWRSQRTLDDELTTQGVVGISGIDTRALTRHLRDRGAMRVGISSAGSTAADLLTRVRQAPAMDGAALAAEVSTTDPYTVPAVGERLFRVAAMDLGIKSMTPQRLAERGIEVTVLPAASTLDDVLAAEPDGVFFSNGPGDPASADHEVAVLRGVLERCIPYFGICFGHQLFGRALGFPTYKLRYGHRGINQPVQDLTTGKVEVTAHNHGFAVAWPGREHVHRPVAWPGREHVHRPVAWPGRKHVHGAVAWPGRQLRESAGLDRRVAMNFPAIRGGGSGGGEGEQRRVQTPYGTATVSHICLNDDVVEGLELTDDRGRLTAFSVQYHPEAAAGPHDAGYLFDRFVSLMDGPHGLSRENQLNKPRASAVSAMSEEPMPARHADETGRKLAPRREGGEG